MQKAALEASLEGNPTPDQQQMVDKVMSGSIPKKVEDADCVVCVKSEDGNVKSLTDSVKDYFKTESADDKKRSAESKTSEDEQAKKEEQKEAALGIEGARVEKVEDVIPCDEYGRNCDSKKRREIVKEISIAGDEAGKKQTVLSDETQDTTGPKSADPGDKRVTQKANFSIPDPKITYTPINRTKFSVNPISKKVDIEAKTPQDIIKPDVESTKKIDYVPEKTQNERLQDCSQGC
jgi:hypothetical protein